MRVFLLRGFFLNSVNYNCARIHFSVAHFGPFNCCAFWTFQLLRILDLSIVAHFGPFNCCAFWTFQLLRILDLSMVAHFGPFILLLRKCAFFYCAFWTTLIILAPVRDCLLRMFVLIVHPSSIDQSISFCTSFLYATSIVHWPGRLFFAHHYYCASIVHRLGHLYICASILVYIHLLSSKALYIFASILVYIHLLSSKALYICAPILVYIHLLSS